MKKKILIVDDIDFIIEFEKSLLKRIEKEKHITINIDEASSVKDALAHINSNQYDAMVIDIDLPDGSGIDIAKAAKKENKKTNVAMLTLSPEKYENDRSYYDFFIKKPILPDQYQKLVEQLLSL